ncbi:hypothetical protein R1sor_007859 [Riccia sorocarpa]|uniref:Uncharacterized protein n=1 Tax=Riccia sorocarpa TaxID=122646 RepID=A0ABD3HS18_9MARC
MVKANTGITYDQIFKEKATGKVLLKTCYPLAWKNLHAGHALIRAWFRHYETDPLQFDLLHENYRLNPDMKRKLNLFVSKRISQLPPLVLVPDGETGTLSFEWKHETVYLHIIAHRQEFKKAQKRRRSLSTADGDSDLELPPKKTQSSRPNSESAEDDPRVLVKSANTDSRNVSGPPFNTCRCEIVEQPLTLPWNLSTSFKFIGFGEPTKVCQNTPYKAYEVRVTDLIKGYDKCESKCYVPHIGNTIGEPLHVHQLTIGCLIDYARCYVTIMEEDDVFARLMKMEWTAKPSNTAGCAVEVAPKNKNKEPKDKECESNHFAENSHKGQTTLQAFKRESMSRQQPTKSTSSVDLQEVEDIYAKLSDEACVIVAMVVVGCNKKDDLPIGLTKYMADVNKRQHKKPFRNHTSLSVGKKIDLVVHSI